MSKEFPYIRGETKPFIKNDPERLLHSIVGKRSGLIREIRGGQGENLKELELRVVKIRELFKNLQEDFGIKVVKTEYIIKNSSEKPECYQIDAFSERIDGKNLEEVLRFTNAQAKQVEELLKKLFEYFKMRYNNKQVILSDIFRAVQYVIGRRQGLEEQEIYLVDIDPVIQVNYQPADIFTFIDILDDLLCFCDAMERKNKSLNLKSLKQSIEEAMFKIDGRKQWTEI